MAEDFESCESYPWWTVVISNLVTLAVYGLGAYITFSVSWIFMAVYLAFVLVLEVRLLAGHCVDCYYYGKSCAFGKGRLSAVFFRRGDPERFNRKTMTWWDMVPDLLVALVPVATGIVLLVRLLLGGARRGRVPAPARDFRKRRGAQLSRLPALQAARAGVPGGAALPEEAG